MATKRKAPPAPLPITRNLEEAIRLILAAHDDPTREGLRETPGRVIKMYAELLTPKSFEFTTFAAEGDADQMIVERSIPFHTLCEHHMVPFFGTASIAYIPGTKMAGLSKLARTLDFFARRLQVQERLTAQIADFLVEQLEPRGVGVVLSAEHMCMTIRGVQKPGTMTTTSALRGVLKEDARARAEFLSLAYGGRQ